MEKQESWKMSLAMSWMAREVRMKSYGKQKNVCHAISEFFLVSFLLNCYPMLLSNFIWIFQNKNKKISVFQFIFSQG